MEGRIFILFLMRWRKVLRDTGLLLMLLVTPLLAVAQEQVGTGQLGDSAGRQTAQLLALAQHCQQLPLLQTEIAAAANQLETLGDEFHLANTAVADRISRSRVGTPEVIAGGSLPPTAL